MSAHALSTAPLAPKDRLIFALDVSSLEEALTWVERLGDAVTFYKLGLEFCMSGDYFTLLAELKARGKKVFADLKFSDVPATVRGAGGADGIRKGIAALAVADAKLLETIPAKQIFSRRMPPGSSSRSPMLSSSYSTGRTRRWLSRLCSGRRWAASLNSTAAVRLR